VWLCSLGNKDQSKKIFSVEATIDFAIDALQIVKEFSWRYWIEWKSYNNADLNVDERSDKSLMDYVESSKQHEDVLKEESTEVREPYVFELDILCMIAGYAGARQPSTATIMMGRNE
jgi:hypothetical protein